MASSSVFGSGWLAEATYLVVGSGAFAGSFAAQPLNATTTAAAIQTPRIEQSSRSGQLSPAREPPVSCACVTGNTGDDVPSPEGDPSRRTNRSRIHGPAWVGI